MSAPPLQARDLTFAYDRTARSVLQTWSAAFEDGSITALVGPSGRGKSTLLYLLGLMLHPSTGDVLVAGTATSSLGDSSRARLRAEQFGFVFQDAALDATRTVLDNVTETALYRGIPRSRVIGQAAELLDRFGVDVPPTRRPGQVSGGQAQRIALCRALLGSPRILLADEPTGNLDPSTSDLVIDAMRSHARRGATVVVVTHAPDVARACDEVITL